LTIALLIPEPFSRARWKKSSGDFFFGIAGGTESNSGAVKCVGRSEMEEQEERDTKGECNSVLLEATKAHCESIGKVTGTR